MTDPPADPKALVRSGYESISEASRADRFEIDGTWYETALVALRDRGSTVLEEWWIPEDDGGHAAFLARAPGPDGVGAR